jgi:hypothetical protein
MSNETDIRVLLVSTEPELIGEVRRSLDLQLKLMPVSRVE